MNKQDELYMKLSGITPEDLLKKFKLWQKLHPEWPIRNRCKYCKFVDESEFDFNLGGFKCNPLHVYYISGCLKFLLKKYYKKHD
jgi:hypothetical protein